MITAFACGSSLALIPIYVYATTDISRQALTSFTAALTIGQLASSVQTLGVFSELEVNWAEPIPSILKMVSLFTFDLEVIRIQCAFKKDDPVLNFIASLMVFPCFVAAVGIMIFLAKTVGKNMKFFL